VENFFDIDEDTLSGYNEFTPYGERHWTWDRFKQKRIQLYKVLTAIGEGVPVTIAAFAEIENRAVLESLISKTPLESMGYGIMHYDSPDDRGIDVGMIYLKEKFNPLCSNKIPIKHHSDSSFNTRDILYVKGLLGSDTLHLFFNHWPSRYGGLLETRDLRMLASEVLQKHTDSLCKAAVAPAILVAGDFNDNPDDASMLLLTDEEPCQLHQLDFAFGNKQVKGTLKYKGRWERFDQFLVNSGIYHTTAAFGLGGKSTVVFSPEYLLIEDEKYGGVKPYRTYEGYRYFGGFSDHLPIFIDLYPTDQQ
jgi:hypothetical protein